MRVQVFPSTITGSIQAAASKSCMQRACAAALLSPGASVIHNPGRSNDDLAALDIIQKLGARVTDNGNSITIHSDGIQPVSDTIHCGESGLSVRMFTPIASLSNQPLAITGAGSLLRRPLIFFNDIFPQLNVSIQSNNGYLPLHISGPLQPADIEVNGSLSSQFLTGLLMAFGASATEKVTITVKDLKSKPYIDLTLQVMEAFGRTVINDNYQTFTLLPQAVNYSPQSYTIEGDWSGAAFLLVAGAIAGRVVVTGLDVSSTQADRAILKALACCGCDLAVRNNEIEVAPASLQGFQFDATDCPDLFPPLVALAAFCKGVTAIKGTTRLTHKESDRAITLQQEFAKLGVCIRLQDDLMLIEGVDNICAARVHSHHDHRIAMACAVAALRANGVVEIDEADAINKSYPTFYEHLQKLGATVVVS